MSLRQKSISGLFWSAAQSWGGQVVTLVVFAVLARLLDPSAFGLVAMANVFVAFTKIFIDQGFAMAIIQRLDLEEEHLSTAFWTNVIVGLFLTGAGIASAGMIAALFGEPQLESIIRWLSIVFMVSSLSAVQQAILKRDFGFRKLAVRSLVAVLISGVIGVTMAFLGYGVWSLVAQQVSNAIVQVALLWRVSTWRPNAVFSFRHFNDLFSYGANIVGINIAEFLNRNADKFLIGYFLGPVSLGYYAVAYKLLETLSRLFASVTNQVVFSSFSALQNNIDRMRAVFYSATQFTSLITFPMFAGFAVIAPYFVVLVFGDQWAASVPVVQILMLAGILESVFLFNGNVMLAMGKPSWRLKLNLLNAFVNVIGFLIAVQWGIVAVAAAYVIRAYLLSPLPLLLVKKLIGLRIDTYLANIRVPVIATVVMAIAVYYAAPELARLVSTQTTVALSVALGICVYFATVAVLSPSLLKKARDLRRDGNRTESTGNSHED
jgi:PST family polysaccharide transporter